MMKICQRTAMNKEFYDYRNSALKRMKRIREESDLFADRHEKLRLDYAFTEFFIVSSIYYYYLQQRQEAIASLNQIPEDEALADTNQLLYYHYLKGSASLVEAGKPEDRKLREFDHLYYTWRTAVQSNHPYFGGNGLQGLANLVLLPMTRFISGKTGTCVRPVRLFGRFAFTFASGTACTRKVP